METKKIHYPSLNGIRAISILLVIFSHLNLQFSAFENISKYLPIIIDGQLGVNIFFIISGFLITSLLIKEKNNSGKISLKAFYTRRTLRIFPAYYFLLFVYFLLDHYHYIFISNISWLTAITYTKYFNWQLDWYTGMAWSLSVEEHFYLIWPLIFLAGKKAQKIFAIFIILLIPLIRIYFYIHPHSWANPLTIFFRLDAIATGCLFALYEQIIKNIFKKYWITIFYLSVILLLLLLFIPQFNIRYNLHLGVFNIPFGGSIGTITNFLIAAIMMFSMYGQRGIWFKFLNSKILTQIGFWSYSLYLWQALFLIKTNYIINQFPVNILFTFIAAIFSYYLIERPFLKFKSKLSRSKA